MSRLHGQTRWYNKRILRKGYSVLRDFSWIENYKLHFNFETNFLENENLFQKTADRFLVESTKIENASFQEHKTAISEANVKTNRIVSGKWTYHKERSFSGNVFSFLKILFHFKNLF